MFFSEKTFKEGPPWGEGVLTTALGDGLTDWGGGLNVLLCFFFFESFLIEKNVNVLSFILAAECSAS